MECPMKNETARSYQFLLQAAIAILCLIVWSMSFQHATAQPAPQIEWARYLPDSGASGIASDAAGNVYTSGTSTLPGAFLAKFDPTGSLLWQHQWGEKFLGSGRVAADGVGSIYIAGTYVTPTTYRAYATLTKFDEAGNFKWMQQIALGDGATGENIAADAMGNVYLCGTYGTKLPYQNKYDHDGFIARFNPEGSQSWLQTLKTDKEDGIGGVAADHQGNVYFTGLTGGSLFGANSGNLDAIVGKFDSSGALAWAKQFGTDKQDIARAISFSPEGNLYVLGNTGGDLAGDVTPYYDDPFVRKYDLSGNELWTRQLELGNSLGTDLTTDGAGGVFLTGMTWPATGVTDGWAAKYDELGNLKWTTTFGSNNLFDDAYGITAQTPFGIYISGSTSTTYSPPDGSAFVVKLVETPEPASGVMAVVAAMAFGGVCRFRQHYVAN